MNKYSAKRTYSELCQREFPSKLEARRAEQLHLLQLADEIKELQYQVLFVLSEKPKITVTIDFAYLKRVEPRFEVFYNDGKIHYEGMLTYEDAKGVLTRDFRTKMAWLKEKFGVDVVLWRG